MNKLICVVDLGHFKVYRVSKELLESPRIELLKSYDTIEAHGKMRDKLTDEAGRFGLIGGKKGVKGYGEAHNIKLDARKKVIKNIAKDITSLIKKEKCDEWYLAAGKSINNQIIDHIDQSVIKKLRMNLKSDITKKHKSDLLDIFKIE